jgi:ribosomal protein S18 acetylase RimI-like enzyme
VVDSALEFKALSVETLPDFLEYFDFQAFSDNPEWSGCFCQFYLLKPGQTEDDTTKEQNRQSACDNVAAERMQGYLAYDSGVVVGWVAAAPSVLFTGVPDAREDLARILCFVIRPDRRGQGVASALLDHAVEQLVARGFAEIEAAPYTLEHQQKANYRGHLAMYQRAGFDVVADMGDFGTLVRKVL